MLKRTTKLRLRRLLRRRTRQVEDMGVAADEQMEKHFFRRLGRLADVRRFVFGWITLVALLIVVLLLQARALQSQYQSLGPAAGGTFTEGIIGKYSNANPLYATSAVDAAVSSLVFAGLFQYDNEGKLGSLLAENMTIDPTGKVYTVTLKPDLLWHDGQRLTSQDVVFTYELIQNPDVRSHLQASWRGVVIEAKDDRTVVFTLPSALGGFPHSLTNGLVPKHVLENVSPEQLRSNDFNTITPVGAGPFRMESVEVDKISDEKQSTSVGLSAFEAYAKGAPKINRYIVRTFAEPKDLERAFVEGRISAMSGLPAMPDSLKDNEETLEASLPVMGQVMVFFKTTQPPLNDPKIRQALVLGAYRSKILTGLDYSLLPSDSPLLKNQIGYDKKLVQKTDNAAAANKILDQAGWKVDPNSGIRKKSGRNLSFRLYSEANPEYAYVAQALQKQWREIGIDMQVALQSSNDLQATVSTHNYDALLYAISTGADPDVYAYWHSSQADVRSNSRLNFSEYQSHIANSALEAGRSRTDKTIRAVKYRPFLEAWLGDNPALSLYQPRYLFVAREPLYNFNVKTLVTPADRYGSVEQWMIREARQ